MRGNGAIVFFSAATSTARGSSFGYTADREFACRRYVYISGHCEGNVEHERDLVGEWDEWRIERGRND